MATVEHWTEEQQEAFKKEHPLAKSKPWVVRDGRLLCGSFDTEEEAKAEASRLDRDDKIAESFSDWVEETEAEYSVDHDTVKEIVKAQL